MRDVLTVINGILFANSLSKALSQGLPGVLQKHLDLLQQAVQRQLAPGAHTAGGAGSSSPMQGQVGPDAMPAQLAAHCWISPQPWQTPHA